MKIKCPHAWKIDYAEAIRIQQRLREEIDPTDAPGIENASILAGADIAYHKSDDVLFAAVVLLRLPEMEIIEQAECSGRVNFPYIPGLLSFREGPILLETFKKLRNRPDVILFDGQGIAHPRGFGLASHMGLLLDTPSIGCAKTRLFGIHEAVGEERGDFAYLMDQETVIGAVLRTKRKIKPIYISVGHRISLQSAIQLILKSDRGYRLPEPTRQAHLAVNRLRMTSGC